MMESRPWIVGSQAAARLARRREYMIAKVVRQGFQLPAGRSSLARLQISSRFFEPIANIAEIVAAEWQRFH